MRPLTAVAGRPPYRHVLFGGFIETALPVGFRVKGRLFNAADIGGVELCEGEALGTKVFV